VHPLHAHPFRTAIEARDINAAVALFAENVVFRSPIVFKPYQGRATVAAILEAVIEVFQDFRYVRQIGHHGDADHVLVFEARIGDTQLQGSDFLHHGPDGTIDELTVMVRPLNAALALAEAMRAKLIPQPRPASVPSDSGSN
jgi:hypothetical protein